VQITKNENSRHETANENVAESFDALAIYLNEKPARFAADIEKRREELRDAEERSRQLVHHPLDGNQLSSDRSTRIAGLPFRSTRQ
jgi:hypothetical protein